MAVYFALFKHVRFYFLSELFIQGYDIFFLLKYTDISLIKNDLNKLVNGFKKPVDEDNLKVLIIEGIIPKSKDMLDYIRRK